MQKRSGQDKYKDNNKKDSGGGALRGKRDTLEKPDRKDSESKSKKDIKAGENIRREAERQAIRDLGNNAKGAQTQKILKNIMGIITALGNQESKNRESQAAYYTENNNIRKKYRANMVNQHRKHCNCF